MKKLLSIFTTFTAISAIAPTVVACKSDGVTVESLTKAIAENADVKTKAKDYKAASADNTKKTALENEVKTKLEAEIKTKLKDKKEVDEAAKLAKDNFTVTARIDGEKVKIKIKKADYVDTWVSDDAKKKETKATYELISGTEFEQEVTPNA